MNTREKLWDMANGITAFAVVHALAVLFAMGEPRFAAAIVSVRWPVILLTGLATVGYGWAIRRMQMLAERSDDPIWRETTRLRIVAVVVVNTLLAAVVLIA